jgi:hypothetical protein
MKGDRPRISQKHGVSDFLFSPVREFGNSAVAE